jgi:replication factor A1
MQKKRRRGRGRPHSAGHSERERKVLEYLARIAVKHEVDSTKFFGCITDAWKKEESEYGQLSVRCREKTEDSAVFLFTTDGNVLCQFPIPNSILQGNNELENYAERLAATSSVANSRPPNLKITDLKAGMKKVDLKAKVLEVPEPKTVYTRYGTPAYVSNALIGDETGTIRMSLWNQQISMVSKGDVINIEDGKVARFRGENQVRIGRRGSLRVTE